MKTRNVKTVITPRAIQIQLKVKHRGEWMCSTRTKKCQLKVIDIESNCPKGAVRCKLCGRRRILQDGGFRPIP